MIVDFPQKKYSIIYADPPWIYKDWNFKQNSNNQFLGVSSSIKRSPSRHYKVMTIDEIKKIPVRDISLDSCILFMWVLPHMMKEGIDVLEHWGFQYKTIAFTWVKKNKKKDSWFWGMGGWTRSNAEHCLLGIKGNPKRINADVHSIIDSPVTKHSEKPSVTREKIVRLCGDLPRIELFAREKIDGWDFWGDEV